MAKEKPDIYELAEAIKTEVAKLGKVSPLNPAWKYFKRAVTGKKIILKPDTVIYRARIVMPQEGENNVDAEEEEDFFDDYQDDEIIENDEDEETTEGDESEHDHKESKESSHNDSDEAVNFVLNEEEKNELEKTEEKDFSKDEIHVEKVEATKEEKTEEKIVVDMDKPQGKLSRLLFAAKDPLTAISEYRKLTLTECILDEIHLTAKKKMADFSIINGTDNRTYALLNNYLSLYFSMYLFDVNSSFYKTARYILEYIMNQKFDGIAYRNNYDRKINFIFFSPRGMMMGASKSMTIQPPPRLDDD